MNLKNYECLNCGKNRSYVDDLDKCGVCGYPTPPLPHLIKEGSINFCECGSSIKTKWFGFIKEGCINARCKNYYKR